MPEFLRVDVVGAVIAGGKVDGTHWDGTGSLSQLEKQALAAAIGLTTPLGAYAETLVELGELAMGLTSPPDAFGTVTITTTGGEATQDVAHFEDTFTPAWTNGWIGVHFDSFTRIRVSLTDEDFLNEDDPIAIVDITPQDLRDAYASGEVWPVRVHNQDSQLLFVRISVTEPDACGGTCGAGLYTACTCAAVDLCDWTEDGVCDSACETGFPGDFFDDSVDCSI